MAAIIEHGAALKDPLL